MTDRLVRSLCARVGALLLLASAAVLIAGCSDEKKDKDKAKDKDNARAGRDSRAIDAEGEPRPEAPSRGEVTDRTKSEKEKSDKGGDKDKRQASPPKDWNADSNPLTGEQFKKGSAGKGSGVFKESLPELGALIVRGQDEGKDKKGKDGTKPDKEKPRSPTVWKREDARKTFARVYVGDGNS